MDIRTRIQEIREAMGISRAELGQRLGVTQHAVRFWENHQRQIHSDNIPEILEALGVTPNEFFQTEKFQAPTKEKLPFLHAVTSLKYVDRTKLEAHLHRVTIEKDLLELALNESTEEIAVQLMRSLESQSNED